MVEETKVLLEIDLVGEVNLPLIMSSSMSIAMLAGNLAILLRFQLEVGVEHCIFTNSLVVATIQDGGMRERSDSHIFLSSNKNKRNIKSRKIDKRKEKY